MNNAFDELIIAWTLLRRKSVWRYVNRNFQNWKAKRKKNERKETKPQNTQELWTTIMEYHMHNGNIRRQRKRKGTAEVSKVLMTENFSKLMTKPNHSSRKLRRPSMINTRKSTPRHIASGWEIMLNQLSASPDIPSFGCSWENQLKNYSVSQETSACRFPSHSS